MKTEVTYYDPPSGRVLLTARVSDAHEVLALRPVGASVASGRVNRRTHYLPAGVVTERPSVPSISNPYPAKLLPSGTEISIEDDLGGVQTLRDPAEALEFEMVGIYDVTVMPPFPYRGVSGRIVVE